MLTLLESDAAVAAAEAAVQDAPSPTARALARIRLSLAVRAADEALYHADPHAYRLRAHDSELAGNGHYYLEC